jgi:uncharacterized protein (DUF1499 family)
MAETRSTRVATVLARTALVLAGICALAELVAGPGYRMGLWTYGGGIQIVRWSATADAVALVLALAAVVAALMYGARAALVVGILGAVLALAALGPPAYMWWLVDQVPRIHDITTDTENPPRFVAVMPLRKGVANSTDVSAEVMAQQKRAYPDLAPAKLDVPPAQALQRAERVARLMGWEIVAVAPQDLRLEATDTTLLFGFKDDIVVRVSPEGTGSRVDARSVSRVGRSDFGVNAKRIRSFLKALAAAA